MATGAVDAVSSVNAEAGGSPPVTAGLLDEVIRPTLAYLDVALPQAEQLLLTMVALNDRLPPSGDGLGPFRITPAQHRRVWDEYLAFNPDLASTVRGLASQRCFLQYPDRELVTNLAYACAIAWILIATSGYDLPAAGDNAAQAALWQRLFGGTANPGAAPGRASA